FSTAAASVLYLAGSIAIRYLSFHLMLQITIGQDNDLSEFDESREIIENLVDEYKACESPDYIKWGMEDPNNMMTGEGNAAGSLDPKSVV
ncbi:tubulin gamma-1 chain, partial [Trifolium medium]|nr:tubulin gamma-1 chain [Trifolium medium]